MRNILYILPILLLLSCGDQPIVPVPIQSEFSKQTSFDLAALIPGVPYFGSYEIPADNPMTVEGIALGRMLFYEKMLSGDNTMSCAGCHKQEFAFSDGLAVSKGIDGIAGDRSSMTIVNALWDKNFFWDGREESLEDQALKPITNPIELHQTLANAVSKLQASSIYPTRFEAAFGDSKVTKERIAKAIAQFERRLLSTNSKYDKVSRGEDSFTAEESNGLSLFTLHPTAGVIRGAGCAECHKFNTMTESKGILMNNGLDLFVKDIGYEAVTKNIINRGEMKVPTLRNIAVSAPYMHDGRFSTLEEVLNHYNSHTIKYNENTNLIIRRDYNDPLDTTHLGLIQSEKDDIISFLKTFTDEDFLTNPDFSDPFDK